MNDKGELLIERVQNQPCDYVPLARRLVIINGEDQDQVKWFEQIGAKEKDRCILSSVGPGDSMDLARRLKDLLTMRHRH